MDFRLSPPEEAFRRELSAWLDANVPPDFDPDRFEFGMSAEERDMHLLHRRVLAQEATFGSAPVHREVVARTLLA